jgi:hypothetical protein
MPNEDSTQELHAADQNNDIVQVCFELILLKSIALGLSQHILVLGLSLLAKGNLMSF